MENTEKIFYRTFISLAVPIIGLQVLSTSVNLLSSLMIGQLGENNIIAVGFCNQFFQMFNLFMIGLCNGTAIFTAQYWGKKDFVGMRQMFMLSMILTELMALLFFSVCQLRPQLVLGLFTDSKEIISIGTGYIKIVSWNYLLTTAINTCNIMLQCTENAKFALISSITSIVTDITVSYYLIFGAGRQNGLGVYGAAYGICTAKCVELVLIIVIIIWKIPFMRKGIFDIFKLPKAFFPKYIKTVTPVVLNMLLYGVGTMLYSAVYGRTKDTEYVAAINIMTNIGSVSKIFMTGAAVAASVVIGREIGAGNKAKAYDEGKRLNKLSPFIGLVCSTFFGILTPFIVRLYKISPDVKTVTIHLMSMLMISVIFETCNHVGLVGILKSGGDSFFNFVVDTIGVWFISLPLLYLSGIVLKLDIEFVYGASLIEIVLKSFAVTYRIRQCKWAKNLVGTNRKESDLIEQA